MSEGTIETKKTTAKEETDYTEIRWIEEPPERIGFWSEPMTKVSA